MGSGILQHTPCTEFHCDDNNHLVFTYRTDALDSWQIPVTKVCHRKRNRWEKAMHERSRTIPIIISSFSTNGRSKSQCYIFWCKKQMLALEAESASTRLWHKSSNKPIEDTATNFPCPRQKSSNIVMVDTREGDASGTCFALERSPFDLHNLGSRSSEEELIQPRT